MGLIDNIKQFFQRRNQKALPEANEENYEYTTSANSNSNLFNMQGNNYNQQSKLDIDIENFLCNYYNNLVNCNFNPPFGNYKMAYKSLVSSNEFISQEQYNRNQYNEQIVCNKWNQSGQYTLQNYKGFFHAKSSNYVMPDFKDMERVYINCKSENIADLADTMLRNNTNPNFYMKFVTNDANVQMPRNEKMVVYCNKNELNYTLQLVQYCKNMRPELFQGSQSLPFLENFENVASIASQPVNMYKQLDGQYKNVPQSVNAYLATMLEESYVQTVNEIARMDNNLSFMFDPNNYNNENLYMQNYPYIAGNYNGYLVSSMKAKLEVLAKNNEIDLDGMSVNRNNNYNEINRQHNQEER